LSQQQQQQQQQHCVAASVPSKHVQSSHQHAPPCVTSSYAPTSTRKCRSVVQPAAYNTPTLSNTAAGGTSAHWLVLERVERSLAVHAALQQPGSTDSSKGGAVAAGGCMRAAAAADMVAFTRLPECWWEVQERPLSDPLLMCLPVWVREALELELMEV
jgi:hypothetical protein